MYVSNYQSASVVPAVLLLWGMVWEGNSRNYDHKRRNLNALCGLSHVDERLKKGNKSHRVGRDETMQRC
jgi:hypothetical protein